MLKIWRSPASRFGTNSKRPNDLLDETITAAKAYTDEILHGIADQGFNAVWIHGRLDHLIPNARFPEFAPHSEAHLNAIRDLIRRGRAHGIGILLYLQPPRAIAENETEFWANHADVAGQTCDLEDVPDQPYTVRSLCTSTDYVRAYIRESFADLTKSLPGLTGYIIISASEYPAHCYSRANCRPGTNPVRKFALSENTPTNCPRCGKREPEEIVAELLNTIRDGVRSVSRETALLFWNWSWSMFVDPPCEEIIGKLPKDSVLLVDFERGGLRKADNALINEYSIGYSGPSEQFQSSEEAAARSGIPIMAKLQLGTTHELATVRSLPSVASIYRKAEYIRRKNLPGIMGCWNFGNLNSTNLVAFNYFLEPDGGLSEREALRKFAEIRYPGRNADAIVNAWETFDRALQEYPFNLDFLYYSALNHALGLIPHPAKLSGLRVGRSWQPETARGNDYSQSVSAEYPLDDIIRRLERLAAIWSEGLTELASALNNDDPDYGNAAICGAAWQSGANLYKIYRLRKNWDDSHLPEYRALVSDEVRTVEGAIEYVERDQYQGWHIEGNFYAFTPETMRKKVKELRNQLNGMA